MQSLCAVLRRKQVPFFLSLMFSDLADDTSYAGILLLRHLILECEGNPRGDAACCELLCRLKPWARRSNPTHSTTTCVPDQCRPTPVGSHRAHAQRRMPMGTALSCMQRVPTPR